jgi:FkbM family methyltransferase
MFVKKMLEIFFNKIGFLLIPKWQINTYLLIKRLKRIIREYEIDCIIDVGANIGQYGDLLRKQVGYKGLLISFEPDPECFNILQQTSRHDELWQVHNFALGNENTTTQLNIMATREFNSFLEPDHEVIDTFKEHNLIKDTVNVQVRRLEQVLTELKSKHVFSRIFLKIDTQGYDLNVFEGAGDSLDQIHGIQTEVSFTPIYKEMPSFEHSIKIFTEKGYKVSGLYAVDESLFPEAVEFDCIYLK